MGSGLDRAIKSVAHIREAQPSVKLRLLVGGQDKQRRFKRQAKRHGVADAVTFLGGRDDVPDLMLQALTSSSPAVRKLISSRRRYTACGNRSRADRS